jgi:hypothetical protein
MNADSMNIRVAGSHSYCRPVVVGIGGIGRCRYLLTLPSPSWCHSSLLPPLLPVKKLAPRANLGRLRYRKRFPASRRP